MALFRLSAETRVLLSFGFKNFFSFREGAEISFRLDAKCPEQISKGHKFSHVLCVKGANASGKTHLIRALSFLSDFCARSFSTDPDEPIALESFYSSLEPTEFYVEFVALDEIEYRYELSVTGAKVVAERLFRTKNKKVKVFERDHNEVTYASKRLEVLKSIEIRNNASIISIGRQHKLNELHEVHFFFANIVTNVGYAGLRDSWVSTQTAAHLLDTTPELLDFVQEFIRECDVGVDAIKIFERPDDDGKPRKYPVFYHLVDGKRRMVTEHTESSGTRTLFRYLGVYKLVLDSGGVLALDEFDINLHPHILPKLVSLFLDEESNPNSAQLLFTTHDGQILDLLGRYRTYLVNKTDNESFAYRLDEIGGDVLRNDRPIFPAYHEGKIGGVPRL